MINAVRAHTVDRVDTVAAMLDGEVLIAEVSQSIVCFSLWREKKPGMTRSTKLSAVKWSEQTIVSFVRYQSALVSRVTNCSRKTFLDGN